jgi:2'-5' RNA ligase/phage-related protein
MTDDLSATAFFRQATEEHSGPFYHGTAHEFQPGDYVDPSYELGGRRGNSHAFMTSDPEVAHNYGKHKAWARGMFEDNVKPHAYEVRPTGPIERDDTVDDQFKAWRTRHPMQVIREVTPKEADDNGHDGRTAGRGRPRRQPGAAGGAAGAGQDAAGAAPAVGADQGGAGPVGQRQVSFHPSAKKELVKLDGDSRRRVAATINALQRGDEGLQTHALSQPLKGWNSTKATRGHRIIHRDLDDGTLHIGYVGLHDYDKAISRLTSLTGFFREANLQQTASVDDYRMMHRAPGPHNAPLHDPTRPTEEGGGGHVQENLDNPDWGGMGEPHEESMAAVHRAKGNPEAPVTIYRAVPHGITSIRTGDWVSTAAEHARNEAIEGGKTDHDGEDNPDYDWPVLKATVPAKHVHTDGNDINEWGYNGPHIEHAAVHGPDEEWTEPTHHTAALQLTDAEEHLLQRQAAAVAHDDGVMVAFVPPRAIAEDLALDGGQLADDLHITLAYLGNKADYTPEQLSLLPQLVSSWAARQKPVTIRTGGVGKFTNAYKDQHVLWAAADIPGGAQMHTSLASELERYGFRLPSEHGWTPHMTLRFVDQHFRFMPHVPDRRWEATEVVAFIGAARHAVRLGRSTSTPATL